MASDGRRAATSSQSCRSRLRGFSRVLGLVEGEIVPGPCYIDIQQYVTTQGRTDEPLHWEKAGLPVTAGITVTARRAATSETVRSSV